MDAFNCNLSHTRSSRTESQPDTQRQSSQSQRPTYTWLVASIWSPSKVFRCRSPCDHSYSDTHSLSLADRHQHSYTHTARVINSHAHPVLTHRHSPGTAGLLTCKPQPQCTHSTSLGYTFAHTAETLLCTPLQIVVQDADLTRRPRDSSSWFCGLMRKKILRARHQVPRSPVPARL